MSISNNKSNNKDDDQRPIVIRNTTDLQRLKLEKLMKNPDKPVVIPEKPKGRSMPNVPDFVRNVMGSSAGAGSGEFHVYRHLRRKEYARQKFIQEKSERERLNDEYHQKLEDNKRAQEEKTAKKRAKRLKKKTKAKDRAKKPKSEKLQSTSESESSNSDVEDANEDNINYNKENNDNTIETVKQSEIIENDNDNSTNNKSIDEIKIEMEKEEDKNN